MSEGKYQFSNNWFERFCKNNWDQLIPQLNPKRILEIGSFEGNSVCYLIDNLANKNEIEIHAVDTWGEGWNMLASI